VAKKLIKKIAAKDADQYMLRLPPGLRDRVASRAAENGRSMNTEIIDAIEKHLKGADRVTELWEAFEKHRENLEAIPRIWEAVEYLERRVDEVAGEDSKPLTEWRWEHEERARLAAMPPITAEQAAHIRKLIAETGASEESFLRARSASSIEEIKEYEKAVFELKHPPRPGGYR
jgi:predicted HicB family RNase H-like nuclease